MSNPAIESQNIAFWDELCGSSLAKSLGITGSDRASLKLFDDWYMDFYHYLHRHIPFAEFQGKRVLEVGLGYGTVSELIASSGARYVGLDIAAGPVRMVQHRLRQQSLAGEAFQGSILASGLADSSFDRVVSIGCYHHTGNLRRALEETRRLLVPGGKAYIMVYNAYSLRRWTRFFRPTVRYFLWDFLRIAEPGRPDADERRAYDSGADGSAAPETVFTSPHRLRMMTAEWAKCQIFRENLDADFFWRKWRRRTYNRWLAPILGLDLYCHLTK